VNPAPSRAVVLVATDRAADAELVRNVLAKEFAKVEVTTRGELATAEFERVRPDVVVLAFDSIAKSQQYCLGLMRFCKAAQSHPHRYVILCGGADLATVFPLCKQDYFDDYVLYWPQPHDGNRLVMAVWNAHRRLTALEHVQPSRAELVGHAESAQAFGAVVDRRLDEGLGHVAAVKASFAKVEQEAARAPAQAGLKSALAASRESLAPMAEWAASFRADVGPHVADAASLAKKVHPQPIVFVVEDDAFAAKIICKSLEDTCRVEVAVQAKALFELLRRMRPAAILMDINLPGMDGLALTEWLKASPTFAEIPVVMLTGEATRESIERSKAVGAADFIVKPFTRDALLAKLVRHLV
jgi:CheY-like chemotaxis protein